MPVSWNAEERKAYRLNEDGEWVDTRVAENPDTGERFALDGQKWVALPRVEGAKDPRAPAVGDNALTASARAAGDIAGGFGLTDEMYSALMGLGDYALGSADTWREAYDERMGKMQGEADYLAETYPTATTAGSVAGAFAGAPRIAGEKLVNLATKLPGGTAGRTFGYGLAGAAEGGALGAATARPGERVSEGVEGALVGGVTGGGVGLASEALPKVLSSILPKKYRPTYGSGKIAETLEGEGMTPARLTARMRQLGDDAVPADATPGLRQLLDDVANKRRVAYSMADRQLGARQEQLGGQVMEAARRATGADKGAFGAANAIGQSKKAIAREFLPKAREEGFKVTDDILDLLKRPTVKSAYDDAVRIAADQNVALPPVDDLANASGDDLFNAFDFVRKALNKRASLVYDDAALANADSATIARSISVDDLARQWRDALKGQNAPYREFLSNYADEFANERAIKLGQTLWRTQGKGGLVDKLDDLTKGMSDTELAYLREGLVGAVQDAVETGSITGNAARRVYRSPRMRTIFRKAVTAGLDDKTAENVWRQFDRSMQAAIEKGTTFQKVTGGSQSALRLQGGDAGLRDARGIGEAIIAGEPASALGGFLDMVKGTLGQPTARQELDLAKFLLSPKPDMAPLYATQQLRQLPESMTRGLLAPSVEASRETGMFGLLPSR